MCRLRTFYNLILLREHLNHERLAQNKFFTLHNGLHRAQNMLLPVSCIQETFTFDQREKMTSQIFLVKTARKGILLNDKVMIKLGRLIKRLAHSRGCRSQYTFSL